MAKTTSKTSYDKGDRYGNATLSAGTVCFFHDSWQAYINVKKGDDEKWKHRSKALRVYHEQMANGHTIEKDILKPTESHPT